MVRLKAWLPAVASPAVAFLVACGVAFTGLAPGQTRSIGANVPTNQSTSGVVMPGDRSELNESLRDPRLQHRILELRKEERKRRMVDNANRLLTLTKQLQADLQGREPTPDDQKRLDEIARLARSVKDQMRN